MCEVATLFHPHQVASHVVVASFMAVSSIASCLLISWGHWESNGLISGFRKDENTPLVDAMCLGASKKPKKKAGGGKKNVAHHIHFIDPYYFVSEQGIGPAEREKEMGFQPQLHL